MAMDWEYTLVIYTIWDNLLRSYDFIKSPAYPEFVEALNRLCPEFPKITHTEIESLGKELQEVMTSPCIEMAPLTAKKDHIGILYHNFKTAGKMIAAQPGYVAQFMNNQIEAPFTQWSLVAWESIKVNFRL
jgi:hypothetical protein